MSLGAHREKSAQPPLSKLI